MHGRPARLLVLATAVLVAGCVTSRSAPVSERTPPTKQSATAVQPAPKPPTQPAAQAQGEFYIVKPGDTLYSIAL